jgi:hypothetical protein
LSSIFRLAPLSGSLRIHNKFHRLVAAAAQQQRQRGKDHHAAVRALAFKWIRIMFRCWQDGAAYDENRYLATLAKRGSPLITVAGNSHAPKPTAQSSVPPIRENSAAETSDTPGGRLGKFGLELRPDKMRRIEFVRFAEQNRKRRGEGKPETFDFLGFSVLQKHTDKEFIMN